MRLVHVNRARITHCEDSLWCRAFRGKSKKDGARRPFRCVLVREGPAGVDIGGHILRKWTQYPKVAGKPLEYLCLDASSGATLRYSHVLAITQRVMKARLPDPTGPVRITTYSEGGGHSSAGSCAHRSKIRLIRVAGQASPIWRRTPQMVQT